jgi:hypothetical protein
MVPYGHGFLTVPYNIIFSKSYDLVQPCCAEIDQSLLCSFSKLKIGFLLSNIMASIFLKLLSCILGVILELKY